LRAKSGPGEWLRRPEMAECKHPLHAATNRGKSAPDQGFEPSPVTHSRRLRSRRSPRSASGPSGAAPRPLHALRKYQLHSARTCPGRPADPRTSHISPTAAQSPCADPPVSLVTPMPGLPPLRCRSRSVQSEPPRRCRSRPARRRSARGASSPPRPSPRWCPANIQARRGAPPQNTNLSRSATGTIEVSSSSTNRTAAASR
jgi:hypothetical protein